MSEKVTVKVERNILHLPAIALRGLVVFPNNLLHFEVGRDKSIAAVEWAVRNKSQIGRGSTSRRRRPMRVLSSITACLSSKRKSRLAGMYSHRKRI